MVISFGELLWDLLPAGAVMGGAPANFAYRLNSLGEPTVLVSRVGMDELGDRAVELLAQAGLRTDFIQREPARPTGTVPIILNADGSPDFTILPDVAFDYIELTPELLGLAPQARCIAFGTLAQRTETSRATLISLLDAAESALKLCDLNLRKDCFTPDTIRGSLERADIVKLNEDELKYLASLFGYRGGLISDLAKKLLEQWKLDVCVVTLGAKGALAVTKRAETIEARSRGVEVVDTCGAGDAFTAGFIKKFLDGAELHSAVAFGNRLGGVVASQPGATTPIPQHTLNELMRRP